MSVLHFSSFVILIPKIICFWEINVNDMQGIDFIEEECVI